MGQIQRDGVNIIVPVELFLFMNLLSQFSVQFSATIFGNRPSASASNKQPEKNVNSVHVEIGVEACRRSFSSPRDLVPQ